MRCSFPNSSTSFGQSQTEQLWTVRASSRASCAMLPRLASLLRAKELSRASRRPMRVIGDNTRTTASGNGPAVHQIEVTARRGPRPLLSIQGPLSGAFSIPRAPRKSMLDRTAASCAKSQAASARTCCLLPIAQSVGLAGRPLGELPTTSARNAAGVGLPRTVGRLEVEPIAIGSESRAHF